MPLIVITPSHRQPQLLILSLSPMFFLPPSFWKLSGLDKPWQGMISAPRTALVCPRGFILGWMRKGRIRDFGRCQSGDLQQEGLADPARRHPRKYSIQNSIIFSFSRTLPSALPQLERPPRPGLTAAPGKCHQSSEIIQNHPKSCPFPHPPRSEHPLPTALKRKGKLNEMK